MMRLCISVLLLLIASPVYPWTYTLDFEGGTVGQDASPYASGGFSGVQNTVKFDNTRAHGGSKSAKFTMGPTGCPGNDRSAFSWLDHDNLAEGQEIWIRWFQWVDSAWTWSNTWNKVVRHWTTDSDGETSHYFVGIGDGWGAVYYGNEPSDELSDNFTSMTKGQWQCFEMYHKISRTTPIARVWRDGILVFENTTWSTLLESGDLVTETQFFGTINCPGLSSSQYLWVDDVVITSDQPASQDAYGNYMIGTGTGGDYTAPTVSDIVPSGSQTYDSGNQTISATTSENATCRWGTLSLSDYYSYSNVMTGGGTTSHTADLTGLSEGTTYTRYGRCIDAAGNQSTTFTWSWSYPASGGGLSPATLRGKFSGGYFK